MSISQLKAGALVPSVKRQLSTLGSDKVRIWLDNLHCVTNSLSEKVTVDGNLCWTPALLETYEEARRALFGLLAGNTAEAVENGWKKLVNHKKTESGGFLVWSSQPQIELQQSISQRKWPTEKLKILGPQIGLLQDFKPTSESEKLFDARETEIDGMIGEIERGFMYFDLLLKKNIHLVQPHLRDHIMEPGQLISINQQNPVKNSATAKKKNITEITDPRFFFYDVIDDPPEWKAHATFSGLNRKLGLPLHDGTGLYSMSKVHHELIHGAQDVSKRALMSDEEYRSFQSANSSKKTNELLADECAAWAMQIEALNAILGGQLEKGIGLEDAEIALQSLPSQRNQLASILGVATDYFSGGRWQENCRFPGRVAYVIFHSYSEFTNWFLLDEHGTRKPLKNWGEAQLLAETTHFSSNLLRMIL